MVPLNSPHIVSYSCLVRHGLNCALNEIMFWDQSDPDFDLSRLLNVKYDGAIKLPIHDSY